MMKIKYLALFAIIFTTHSGFSQSVFRFNEYSCSNISTITDQLSLPGASGSSYFASPDWVEIYNTSTSLTPVQLSGWYLSDDRYNLRKWQFPLVNNQLIKLDSHAVIVVYLCKHNKAIAGAPGKPDTLHANFDLDQTKPGTTLYLTKNIPPYSVAADSVLIQRTKPNHSWGIPYKKGANWVRNWKLYKAPTPWNINPNNTPSVTPVYYKGYAPTPKISLAPGYYSSPQTLTISDTTNNPDPDLELFYSNDCTTPALNGNAPLTPSTVDLGATSSASSGNATTQSTYQSGAGCFAVRAIIHSMGTSAQPQYLDSFEAYSSYLIDSTYKLCFTCVCVDTSTLFVAQSKDTVPMLLTYFDKNKKQVLKNQGQGMIKKLHFKNYTGPASINKQWQFLFRSEDEYGYNYTNNYGFFTDQTLGLSNRTDFPELIFRAGSEENYLLGGANLATGYGATHMRDFYNHTISLRHDLNYEAAHYKPTYMFINGSFRGIYYVKEPIDSFYTNYYYNRPHAAIVGNDINQGATPTTYSANVHDTIAGFGSSVYNAVSNWNIFYSWAMLGSTNVHSPAIYGWLSDSLDFASLNDYMIFNMLSVNSDFVNRYATWWKGLPTDTSDHRHSKWRFALSNTDMTWGFEIKDTGNVTNVTQASTPCDYTMTPVTNMNQPLLPLWTKLMTNDTFKTSFLVRYADLLNTALSCDSLKDHLKYIRSLFVPGDMASHVWWEVSNATACSGCDSLHFWKVMLDSMNAFLAERCSLVTQGLKDCYSLVGPYNLCIDAAPSGDGYVIFNNMTLKNFIWNGKYFDSLMCHAVAIPDSNYTFDHWETTPSTYTLYPNNKSDSIGFYVSRDVCLKAVFKIKDPDKTFGTPMIPTGFSPNGDGNNDIFNLYGIANASTYEMEVYNRWGELIFRSTDKSLGWDGSFNGTPVPVGVYAYRYNVVMSGKTYASKGNVTLLR